MIILEMILLWLALFFVVCTIGLLIQGHERGPLIVVITVTLITMYVTLVRHSDGIRDSVVFG